MTQVKLDLEKLETLEKRPFPIFHLGKVGKNAFVV